MGSSLTKVQKFKPSQESNHSNNNSFQKINQNEPEDLHSTSVQNSKITTSSMIREDFVVPPGMVVESSEPSIADDNFVAGKMNCKSAAQANNNCNSNSDKSGRKTNCIKCIM